MVRSRRLLQVLTVAISAYYALWACAPAATFRPVTDLAVGGNELGLGGSGTVSVGSAPSCGADPYGLCQQGAAGQLWYTHRFSQRFSFGGTVFGGQPSLFGVGANVRFHWADLDNFKVGTDIDAGFLYFALGVPMSVRLGGSWWLYTDPSIGYRVVQPLRVPLGVSWNVDDHWALSAEVAYGFDFLTEPVRPLSTDFVTAGLAGSFRF